MTGTDRPAAFSDFTLEQAWEYDKWYSNGAGREIGNVQRDCFRRLLGEKNDGSLLDIGSGTGYFSRWFRSLGFHVSGVDPAPKMVAYSYMDSGLGIDYRVACAERLPFPDNSFDLAVFATSFEFVDDPRKAVSEAFRVASARIVMLMLQPEHEMNRKRIEKSKRKASPFSEARLWRQEELIDFMREAGPEGCEVCPSGCAVDLPYYFIQAIISGTAVSCDNSDCR